MNERKKGRKEGKKNESMKEKKRIIGRQGKKTERTTETKTVSQD